MLDYITLDEAIDTELNDHPELRKAYQEELLLNEIAGQHGSDELCCSPDRA